MYHLTKPISLYRYLCISIYMRTVEVIKGDLTLKDKVDVIYEKVITKFGTSAKIDAQKKYIGKKALVLILKD
jgi:putative transposon-encoded protein